MLLSPSTPENICPLERVLNYMLVSYSAEIIQLEAVLSLLKKTLAVHANVKVSA